MAKGDGIFGPTDYNLIAVLRYNQSSLDRLKSRAKVVRSGAHSIRLPGRLDWFPAQLLAAIKPCPTGWCVEGQEFAGTEFLKGGFVTGYFVVPADQQFVILRLGT